MALMTTATGGLSPTMKTVYQRTLLENARDVQVHRQFGKEYTLPKNGGKIMEWRRASVLATVPTALVEGAPYTENAFSYTAITVTISQYGDYIKGSDLLQMSSFDNILDDINTEQGDQAGRTIDELTREAIQAGTNVRYANGRVSRVTVATGDKLTSLEIIKARRTLKVGKAKPYSGRFYAAIIHPMTEADLLQDATIVTAFNSETTNGGQRLFNGEVGAYMSVKFTVSTLAKVFTGAGAAGIDVYSTLFVGKDAFGVTELEGLGLEHIFTPKGSAGGADPLQQYWTNGWKCSYAVKILNDAFMVRVEHAVGA